ncbi:hypothetical protein [Lysinibacillus sphaericus]|uniref:hypothetical protein n=1 Tax=Lysinibacillus sphaericus TaxID=1421 RepID=UPI003D7FA045
MHGLNLVDSLKSFLEEKLKDLELPTKIPDIYKMPNIYGGYPPPKPSQRNDEEDSEGYPFVIVRYLGQTDVLYAKKTIAIRIIIGTYSKDEQNGWRDNLNVWNRIELALKETQTIGAFSLTGKIEVELFEEHMRPNWHSTAILEFDAPQIQLDRSVLEDEF